MNAMVESLKRLFESERVTLEQINILKRKGKITLTEYNYIIEKGVK